MYEDKIDLIVTSTVLRTVSSVMCNSEARITTSVDHKRDEMRKYNAETGKYR